MPPSTPAERPRASNVVGERYELAEQLGRGGMAVVYRAVDASKGVTVALKRAVLHKDPAHARELRALFEREFHTLAQLKHPSVIAVYDFGVDPSGPYYTMELLEGGDLTDASPLPYRRACALLMQISSSLALLHARGMLHRDVTPRNVRCTSDERAKLIDFGAMTAIGPCTRVVGTPPFMAPEVAHRMTLDARTDLFALGATLYYALTNQLAYAARTFSDLRDAWRQEPAPPSAFVPEIPPALDALVLSLLAIDPDRRPRSAIEVMQRLAAIAGVEELDTSAVSQAYLATPLLVGRDLELQLFGVHMQSALQGSGGGLLFEGASGSGRTRMLDACVLEAKTLGAIVLRVRGGSGESAAFASAHDLVAQLCEVLPREAWQCAREAGAHSVLFESSPDEAAPALLPLSEWRSPRIVLQTALAHWVRCVCVKHPLLVAVDDTEDVDEASLALIAALAHAGKTLPMAIVAMVAQDATALGALSLRVLREHSLRAPLLPLSAADTEALLGSVFANAPNLRLLSDRIYRVAAGSPRESMALAQHLLDRKLVRYADGVFRLPAELALQDLPASIEDAVLTQLASVSALGLSLVQTQALAIDGPWSRADYAEIAGAPAAHQVDEAISHLLRLGAVVSMGGVYVLKHHGLRGHLVAQLPAELLAERHRQLAELCARSSRVPLLEIYHALLGGDAARGLRCTATLLDTLVGGALIFEQYALDPKWIATILECAFQHASAADRPARELSELARHLTGLSIPTDTRLFYQYGERWLKQLKQDSGLDDYEACDVELPAADRLKLAADKTLARYAATPEQARVYSLFDAIKHLTQYVASGIVVGSRRCDTQLLESLAPMLEPFVALSPGLHALWQNVIAACEINYRALPEQGRERLLKVYAVLLEVSVQDLPTVDAFRNAIAYALGVLEVSLGLPTADAWIEIMQANPLHQVNAMYLRRILAIYDDDAAAAEHYRAQAELLAVQASSRQMFDAQAVLELAAHMHVRDLTGVKHMADRIEQYAQDQPGWAGYSHLAQSYYHRLRGDLHAAKRHCECALALVDVRASDPPPSMNLWVNTAGNYVHVLNELGDSVAARAFAEQARTICVDRGFVMRGWPAHIERGLAIAEAKQGDFALARARIDRLLEQRASLGPARLSVDYEARARVAICERDAEATRHYVALSVNATHAGASKARLKQASLMDEAKQAGLEIELPMSGFESSVIGSEPRGHDSAARIATILQSVPNRAARVRGALELLCDAGQAPRAHLFLMRDSELSCAASVGEAATAALVAYATSCWQGELGRADVDSQVTGAVDLDPGPTAGEWTVDEGHAYRVVPLRSDALGRAGLVGLVLLATRGEPALPAGYWAVSHATVISLVEHGDAHVITTQL
jgi:hypothetical protein